MKRALSMGPLTKHRPQGLRPPVTVWQADVTSFRTRPTGETDPGHAGRHAHGVTFTRTGAPTARVTVWFYAAHNPAGDGTYVCRYRYTWGHGDTQGTHGRLAKADKSARNTAASYLHTTSPGEDDLGGIFASPWLPWLTVTFTARSRVLRGRPVPGPLTLPSALLYGRAFAEAIAAHCAPHTGHRHITVGCYPGQCRGSVGAPIAARFDAIPLWDFTFTDADEAAR